MKVAIIEIGGSHDECLYSQIKFLKSVDNIHLTLICKDSLRKNISYFDLVDEKWFVKVRSGLKGWLDTFKLKRKLDKENFTKVILNTAQGSPIKKLLFFPQKKQIEFIGVLHNIKKLQGSFSQKIITKKISKYFLLNDYLLKNIAEHIKSTLQIGTFYPIFFPNYRQVPVEKKENDIWICIPGQVELNRRDYLSLTESIERTGINKNVKFVLLGKSEHKYGDGALLKKKIAELHVEDHFILWDDFIEPTLFYTIIQKSDFIMPLIHSNHISYQLYKNQISGAFNLAFGYKKVLLMESSFNKYDDFKNNSIFYETNNILEIINSLKKDVGINAYNEKKWTFDYQKNKYLKMINEPFPYKE